MEHEASRREAVEATLERNPNAFRPNIAGSPQVNRATKLKMAGGETAKRVRGQSRMFQTILEASTFKKNWEDLMEWKNDRRWMCGAQKTWLSVLSIYETRRARNKRIFNGELGLH